MTHQSQRLQSPPLPGVHRALSAAALAGTLLLAPGTGRGAAYTVAAVTFDSANSTTTTLITSGGYVTDAGAALHSGTSPRWSVPDSLGTRFLAPTFQASAFVAPDGKGVAGSAVTLGHDPSFPQTSANARDIIQLGWGAGTGLSNPVGNDLAIFEAATSEALGVRLFVNALGWTSWRYTPYERLYDSPNDATVTLIDFSDFGVAADPTDPAAASIVTAVEIANLLPTDTVDTLILDDPYNPFHLGWGNLSFDPAAPPSPSTRSPGRYSTSQGLWVPFESNKFDPDIQYVVGLHALAAGAYGAITAASYSLPLSPAFAAATLVPAPATLALLAPLLLLHRWRRHRSAA